jgi:hypothetical protein
MSHKEQAHWITTHTIHQELINVKYRIYDLSSFECTQPKRELESAEYAAYTFKVNSLSIQFRVAKITPKKAGQFVTLWKRIGNSPIQPYDFSDSIDFFVINARKDNRCGQFVFPKSILSQHDVVSMNGNAGKRAIRVYPPWDINLNRQAKKTQEWQVEYFLEIPNNGEIDIARAKKLYRKI